MKIIHCADLHLDSKMTAKLDKEKAKERRLEILKTFSKMVEYAASNDVSAILIAGDMFDTSNVSALARNTVSDSIVTHPEIIFYYLNGNHDRDNFLSSLEEVPENLKLFDNTWTSYRVSNDANDTNVIITATELTKENSGSCYNSLLLNPSDINIVMLHGQETLTGSGDNAELVNLRELKNKNIDYLALGHIHSYKEAPLDARGVYCYAGALEGRGFDEPGEHGFVLLNINENSGSIEREFISFASRKLVSLDVDISEAMTTADIIKLIDEALKLYPVGSRNLLKLSLTGNVDIECEKDTDYLLKHYEPLFYFMKIYDESKLKVNYEDYRLDASLKGEFVRSIIAATDISEADKPAVIRMGIRAIAGEEI